MTELRTIRRERDNLFDLSTQPGSNISQVPRLQSRSALDEPSAGQHYGGAVAALVFSAVMGGALRLLAVPNDLPLADIVLPPAGAPEIKEEV